MSAQQGLYLLVLGSLTVDFMESRRIDLKALFFHRKKEVSMIDEKLKGTCDV